MLHNLFNLETALHVSGGTTTHHQERKQLYLQYLVFVTPLLLFRGFGSLKVACWPLVPKFAGSHPAEVVGFKSEKILSTPFFGGKVKPSVPCRSFATCKRSLNVTCKTAFRQNYRTFLAHSSTFRRWVLSRGDTRGDGWWRKLKRLTKIAQ
jgi:hypothetical protein